MTAAIITSWTTLAWLWGVTQARRWARRKRL